MNPADLSKLNDARYRLSFPGSSETPRECSWEELARDNEEDQELIETISAIRVGEARTFGGGAALLVRIERIA